MEKIDQIKINEVRELEESIRRNKEILNRLNANNFNDELEY